MSILLLCYKYATTGGVRVDAAPCGHLCELGAEVRLEGHAPVVPGRADEGEAVEARPACWKVGVLLE